MLEWNDIQYLVGILTLVAQPETVEVELGSMVFDEAADKPRDIDVTVTFKDLQGNIVGLKGIEVKDHSKKLDVEAVEQLCIKFNDMPSITHRAIVSSIGYTDGARKKAQHHGVELLCLVKWTDRIDISHYTVAKEALLTSRFIETRFYWEGNSHVVFNPDEAVNDEIKNAFLKNPPVYDQVGQIVSGNETLSVLGENLSLQVLNYIKDHRANEIGIGQSKQVQFPVILEEPYYIHINGNPYCLKRANVRGIISCDQIETNFEYKILVKDGDNKPYVACAVAEISNKDLIGVTFSHEVKLIRIPASDRLIKKIRSHRLH
jgi:hypothetical protein